MQGEATIWRRLAAPRSRIGIAGLVITMIAAVSWGLRPDENTTAVILLRVGLILGAIWLAWSDLRRMPKWLSIAGGFALLAMARNPMLAVFVIPAAMILKFVWPRKKKELEG